MIECSCGDCIVTAGTLANLPAEAVQLGLSEGHCYCICRVESFCVVYCRWKQLKESACYNYVTLGEWDLGKEHIPIRIHFTGLHHFEFVFLFGVSSRLYVLIINIVFLILIMMMDCSGWNILILYVISEGCKVYYEYVTLAM